MFLNLVELLQADKKIAVCNARSRYVFFCNTQFAGIRAVKKQKVTAMSCLVTQYSERFVMAGMGNLIEITLHVFKYCGRLVDRCSFLLWHKRLVPDCILFTAQNFSVLIVIYNCMQVLCTH